MWQSINLNEEPWADPLTSFTICFPSNHMKYAWCEPLAQTALVLQDHWVLLRANGAGSSSSELVGSGLNVDQVSVRRNEFSHGRGAAQASSSISVLHLLSCTSGRREAQLRLLLLPPLDHLLLYGGLSTFTLVTLPVKHLWNRMSGFGGWLSQSSLRLMKCFLNPCGPLEEVSLPWLDPSLASLPDGAYFQITYCLECWSVECGEFLHVTGAGLTWHSEGQAVVRVPGLGGDKEVTKDTHCDEEGEQDHSRNGQTNQSPEAAGEERREGGKDKENVTER